jgi:4'-phosphopantetheinyl transferase
VINERPYLSNAILKTPPMMMQNNTIPCGNDHGLPARVYAAKLEDIDLSAATALLDRSETAHANAIPHQESRETFIRSRAMLRAVLSREIGVSPAKVPLTFNAHGKPELATRDGMHFNVSHSSGMALVAIHTRPIGVDIELVDERIPHLDLAGDLFTVAEQKELSKPDCDRERTRQFFRIWTRKEAFLKGLGTGFAADPKLFDVIDPRAVESSGWQLHPLPVAADWEAAIAVADAAKDVHMVDVVSFQPFRVRRRRTPGKPLRAKMTSACRTLH